MKILMTFSHFPMSIPRYFKEAFERNGHTVYTAGIPFHNWIPWTAEGADHEGMHLAPRYAIEPTVALEAGVTYTWNSILSQLPEPPDLILNHPLPAGIYSASIVGRPRGVRYGLLLTDPHVLEWHYKTVRYEADYVFNMQDCYKQEGDYYIPYAYAPQYHFIEQEYPLGKEREIDVACIGLQYPNRKLVMDELMFNNRRVRSQVGLVFDEYRDAYNNAKVAFSWSSQNDTIARVFEAPRMGAALVCNLTPDLFKFFNPDEVTVFRGGVNEAVDACEILLDDDELRQEMVLRGYRAMKEHTYDHRARLIEGIVRMDLPAVATNRSTSAWLEDLKEQRAA